MCAEAHPKDLWLFGSLPGNCSEYGSLGALSGLMDIHIMVDL